MDTSNRNGTGLLRRVGMTKLLPWALPGGGVLSLLGGCFAAAGVVGGVLAVLLTGLFLTSLQASFAATAHSYAYTEFAAPQILFHSSSSGSPSLVSFCGSLPGFHLVIINSDSNKAMVSAQTDGEVQVFQTEVEIDFSASPPMRGVIRECQVGSDGVLQCAGGAEVPLEDLYRVTSVTREIVPGQGVAEWIGRLHVAAVGVNDEELDYTLEMKLGLADDGRSLTGSTNVFRSVSFPGEGALTNESIGAQGSLQGDKIGEGTADGGAGNAGVNDNAGDNLNQDNANGDALGDGNDNANDQPGDGQNANAGDVNNENDNAADSGGNDNAANDNGESQSVAELCPGVPDLAVFAIDQVITGLGLDGFDIDQDGFVTPQEVQDVINPSVAPLGVSLSDSAAACVAAIVNG